MARLSRDVLADFLRENEYAVRLTAKRNPNPPGSRAHDAWEEVARRAATHDDGLVNFDHLGWMTQERIVRVIAKKLSDEYELVGWFLSNGVRSWPGIGELNRLLAGSA